MRAVRPPARDPWHCKEPTLQTDKLIPSSEMNHIFIFPLFFPSRSFFEKDVRNVCTPTKSFFRGVPGERTPFEAEKAAAAAEELKKLEDEAAEFKRKKEEAEADLQRKKEEAASVRSNQHALSFPFGHLLLCCSVSRYFASAFSLRKCNRCENCSSRKMFFAAELRKCICHCESAFFRIWTSNVHFSL